MRLEPMEPTELEGVQVQRWLSVLFSLRRDFLHQEIQDPLVVLSKTPRVFTEDGKINVEPSEHRWAKPAVAARS